MKIDLKITGLKEALALSANTFSDRRIRAALATGLTKTAVAIKAAELQGLQTDLDRPTAWTLGSLYAKPADATTLQAEVGFKQVAGTGTPAWKYLLPEIEGGPRRTKRFEVALQRSGLMPAGWRAVPGRGAKLDGYGNVSQGQIKQILSQLAVVTTTRRTVVPGRSDDRKTQSKRRRAFGKSGGQYFALTKQRGKLRPGIYLASGRDHGAKLGYGRTGTVTAVFVFVPSVTYRPRFEFYGRGQNVAAQQLAGHTSQALVDSMARLNARAVQP